MFDFDIINVRTWKVATRDSDSQSITKLIRELQNLPT